MRYKSQHATSYNKYFNGGYHRLYTNLTIPLFYWQDGHFIDSLGIILLLSQLVSMPLYLFMEFAFTSRILSGVALRIMNATTFVNQPFIKSTKERYPIDICFELSRWIYYNPVSKYMSDITDIHPRLKIKFDSQQSNDRLHGRTVILHKRSRKNPKQCDVFICTRGTHPSSSIDWILSIVNSYLKPMHSLIKDPFAMTQFHIDYLMKSIINDKLEKNIIDFFKKKCDSDIKNIPLYNPREESTFWKEWKSVVNESGLTFDEKELLIHKDNHIFDYTPKCHGGYQQILYGKQHGNDKSLYDDICTHISDLDKSYEEGIHTINFTGHSMGAGISSIMCYNMMCNAIFGQKVRAIKSKRESVEINLVTLALPTMGNTHYNELTRYLEEHTTLKRYDFYNRNDIISRAPPTILFESDRQFEFDMWSPAMDVHSQKITKGKPGSLRKALLQGPWTFGTDHIISNYIINFNKIKPNFDFNKAFQSCNQYSKIYNIDPNFFSNDCYC